MAQYSNYVLSSGRGVSSPGMVQQRGREGAALELREWGRECRRQSCPQDMDVSHLGCSPRWLQAKEAGNELALTSSLSFHSSANLHPPGQKNRNEKKIKIR